MSTSTPAQTGSSAATSASVTGTIVLGQPVGTIAAFYGQQADLIPGWLLCDGVAFSSVTYPVLAKLLNSTNTPNLQGYFVRGLDPAGKVDPQGASRSLGSIQQDALAAHTHTYEHWFWNNESPAAIGEFGTNYANNPVQNTGATGEDETRPKNISLNYIIFAGFPVGQPQPT
jgi:hypothetical protein